MITNDSHGRRPGATGGAAGLGAFTFAGVGSESADRDTRLSRLGLSPALSGPQDVTPAAREAASQW